MRYLLALLSFYYELVFLFLLVPYAFRLLMNYHQTNISPLLSLKCLCVYYEKLFTLTFLTIIHYPKFSISAHHCLIMTNTIACVMKREAGTWYLPSHLVPAKFTCSSVNHVLRVSKSVLY